MAAAALAVADAAQRVGQVKARMARAQTEQHASALAAQLAPYVQQWQALQVRCCIFNIISDSFFFVTTQADALEAVQSMMGAMQGALQAVPLVGGASVGDDAQQASGQSCVVLTDHHHHGSGAGGCT